MPATMKSTRKKARQLTLYINHVAYFTSKTDVTTVVNSTRKTMTSAKPEIQCHYCHKQGHFKKVCIKKEKDQQSKPVTGEKTPVSDTPKRSRHQDHTLQSTGKHYSNGKCHNVHVLDHSSSNFSDPDSSSCSYSPYKPHKNPPYRSRHILH